MFVFTSVLRLFLSLGGGVRTCSEGGNIAAAASPVPSQAGVSSARPPSSPHPLEAAVVSTSPPLVESGLSQDEHQSAHSQNVLGPGAGVLILGRTGEGGEGGGEGRGEGAGIGCMGRAGGEGGGLIVWKSGEKERWGGEGREREGPLAVYAFF